MNNMGKFDLSEIKKQPKQNILKPDTEPRPKKATKKPSKRLGRPPKREEDRLKKQITVNFTEAEFDKLSELSKQYFNIAIPKLIRNLLRQDGHI